MTERPFSPLVHLELQTSDLPRAREFLVRLFGWHTETVRVGGQLYVTLNLGIEIGGGIVERGTGETGWLPYVEVPDIKEATEHGRLLGASVVVMPREGPAGWRSLLAPPGGGEIALWQAKR